MQASDVEINTLHAGYSAIRNTVKPLSQFAPGHGHLKVGMKLTPQILEALGMSRSESYEVRIAWRHLGWLNQDDCITPRCGQLAFAASEGSFQDLLSTCLHDRYPTIFEQIDVTHASQQALKDVFMRTPFEPASMRLKMLSLFKGLCKMAGLLADETDSFKEVTQHHSETTPLSLQELPALDIDDTVEGNPPMVEPPSHPLMNGSAPVSGDDRAEELGELLTTLQRLPHSPGWTEELRPWLRQGVSHVAGLIQQALAVQGGKKR